MMSSDTILGDIVHRLRPDLYLDREGEKSQDGRMEALIIIKFRYCDIILDLIDQRIEVTVDDTECIITIRHGICDYPEGYHIEYFREIKCLIFLHEFLVDPVWTLHSPIDTIVIHPSIFEKFTDTHDTFVDIFVRIGIALSQIMNDLTVFIGMEYLEDAILQIDLKLVESELLTERDIDFHRLHGDPDLLLFFGMKAECLDIVHTVSELDEDDSQILCHSEKCLLQCLNLSIFSLVSYFRYFYQSFTECGHFYPKFFLDILIGDRCVFDHVMEDTGLDSLYIRPDREEKLCRS